MLSKGFNVTRGSGITLLWLVAALVLGPYTAFSQRKLETPQETNDRIRQLAAALEGKQGDYVIGSGDLVHIDVFDVPELSRDFRVGQSGYISLPLLPVKIRAGGLSALQLEEKVAELLQANGLVSQPHVTVSLREQRSQPITVIGAVNHPIVYMATRPTSLLEVLTEAGGIAGDAGSRIIVTRAQAQNVEGEQNNAGATSEAASAAPPMTITINLNDLLESGGAKFNIPLQGGDVVSVPRAGIVYVIGAVGRPGGFVLANDQEQMTTLKILALAGGLKGTAKPRQTVILRRNPDTGQRQEVNVDLNKVLERKAEDARLLPSDILFVPDSTGKKALRRTGEIALGITSGVALVRLAQY